MSKRKPTTTADYVKPPLASTFNPSRPPINMTSTVGGPTTTSNIEQLCNVFYHGEYHRAIALSNTLQHDLLYTLLTVLNVRARSLAQCGLFEQAMEDARFMMEQAPKLAVGYLCGGWIYAMQGRQRAAIEIYTLGLEHVQPDSDEESYAQLQQGKATAEIQQSKRIDFISKLPFDILPNVVSRFFYNHMPGEHVYYLDISRTWRDRIYQCTKHSLRFIGYQLADNYTRLVEAAPYVSELAISSVSHAPNDVLDQLRHGSFRSLRVLKLTYCPVDNPSLLLEALTQVSDTLTSINLKLKPDEISAGTVLSVCHRLNSLVYSGGLIEDIDLRNVPETLGLKRLSLHVEEGIRSSTLQPILRRCPSLELLEVDRCLDANCLDLIRQYCPDLLYLNFNAVNGGRETWPELPRIEDEDGGGLQVLEIARIDDATTEHLIAYMEENMSNSLQELSLSSIAQRRHRLQKPLKRLHTLRCWPSEHVGTLDDEDPFPSSIIRQSRNLKSVIFEQAQLLGPETFMALAQLDELTHLQCFDSLRISDQGLRRFLEKHKTQGSRSALQHLTLDHGLQAMSDDTLDVLGGVTSLTALSMADTQLITKDAFEAFAHKLRYFPHLVTLGFSLMDCVTDVALWHLYDSKSLKSIALYDLANITNDGVACLADYDNLEYLEIDCCNEEAIEPSLVRLVRRMRYIINKYTKSPSSSSK